VNLGGNGSTSSTSSTSPVGSPVDSPTESPSANSDFPSGNYVMFTSIKITLILCCDKLTIS